MISIPRSLADFRPFAACALALMLVGTWLTIAINRDPAVGDGLRVPLNGYVYASYALAICATAWLVRWQRARGDQGCLERELRALRNRLLTLADQAEVSLLSVDAHGRIEDVFGADPPGLAGAAPGASVLELFAVDPQFAESLEVALHNGRPCHTTLGVAGRSLRIDARPRAAADGGRAGLLIAVRDDTRRRAERDALALARRELERVQTTLEFHRNESLTPMALFDADGRMVDANPAFCDRLGYRREEILRLSTEDLTDPQDIGRSIELILALRSGAQDRGQLAKRYVRKDGTVFPAVTHVCVRRDETRRILGVLAQLE